jgi:hypothetical protein
MTSRGGSLEVTISTTPNEMMSVAVNMEQNGWSLGECLELVGFLPPSHSPRVDGDSERRTTPRLPARRRGEKKAPRSSSPSSS